MSAHIILLLDIYVSMIGLQESFTTSTVTCYYPDNYIGCFEDKGIFNERILPVRLADSDSNSRQECGQACKNSGYILAGTENGDECFCGNTMKDYEKVDDTECDELCTGNEDEYCGGNWRISIYNISQITHQTSTQIPKTRDTSSDIPTTYTSSSELAETTLTSLAIYNTSLDEYATMKTEKPETTVKLPSSTTKTTTEHNKTSTAATAKQSTTYAKSSEDTRIDTKTNMTASPYIKSADSSGSSMIAMYIALPLGVLVILVIIAIVMKRRRQRKKEPVPEIICPETGPMPDIHANVSSQEGGTELEHGNQSHTTSRDEAVRLGNEVGVSYKEGKVSLDQETEEYNTITLRPNNKTVSHNSYDHVVKPRSSVVETYANLSAIQLGNKHISASNTYSHTEKSPGHNSVSSTAENTVNTYSTLEARANPHPNIAGGRMEEYSVYDRTDRGLSDRMEGADNYSHMSTVISLQNGNIVNRKIGNDNVYLNEEEYATVQKAVKK